MKKSILTAFIFLGIFTISCSSDDGDNGGSTSNFLPLTTGDQWTYDVIGGGAVQTDILSVGNNITINGKVYKQMQTASDPNGFYSLTLRNNGLRKDGAKWLLQGTLDFGDDLPLPINFALNDFVILDGNASNGAILSNLEGTETQDLSGFPVTVTYKLRTISQGTQSSFTTPAPQNQTYQNVKVVKVELRLKITTTQTLVPGFPPITVTILDDQAVVNSTQYYVQNIGMVYNNTDFQYNLAINPSQFNLPIPQSSSQNQKEFLVAHQVAN
ncbi:MAG: hypothetical protein ACK4K1_10655 [Flavobacterium sp.]